MSKIIVVGSSNTDMVVHTSHLPVPGETILGGKFLMNQGGKGANQAVAVKRLGDRKSTRLNSSHRCTSRMPSSA